MIVYRSAHPATAALYRQRGAYLTELLVVFPVFIFLVLACIQMGLIYRARITLGYATFEAAREGSLANARPIPVTFTGVVPSGIDVSTGSVLQGLVRGLFPLYPSGTDAGSLVVGYGKAAIDVAGNSCIEYLQPTQAAFLDWGIVELQGRDKNVIKIPNDTLRYRKPLAVDYATSPQRSNLEGLFSGYSIQEANVLKIKVRYAYEPRLPVIGPAIVALLAGMDTDADAFDRTAYSKSRIPLQSVATVRMQSPVQWHPFYPLGFLPESNSSWNYTADGNPIWALQFGLINQLRGIAKFSDTSAAVTARLPLCLNTEYYFGAATVVTSLPSAGDIFQ